MNKQKYIFNLLLPKKKKHVYPLLNKGLSQQDLNQGIKVLKTGNITMNRFTYLFEKEFTKKINVKYAVMVNSGSSANLIATFASCNPLRKNRFKKGDEAIIPVLCWSTSLWPLVQAGLKIKFVDVNPKTLNANAEDIISHISRKTKVILLVNVLGLSTQVDKIRNICFKKKIILIEDNCESLGTKFKNKFLGTFGDFGTFSFFYSHPISSGEGGMVVCNNKSDYEILKSLRSHGWSRDKKISIKYPDLDPRYIFINSGFNLRPTDIQAAIASRQLKKLKKMQKIRFQNKNRIISYLKKSKNWNNQFKFIDPPKEFDPSYMVFPILLNPIFKNKKKKIINYLEFNGLETRPIISGSFVNQPSAKIYKLNLKKKFFKGAQKIQDLGFVIGLHTQNINKKKLRFLEKILLSINEI